MAVTLSVQHAQSLTILFQLNWIVIYQINYITPKRLRNMN